MSHRRAVWISGSTSQSPLAPCLGAMSTEQQSEIIVLASPVHRAEASWSFKYIRNDQVGLGTLCWKEYKIRQNPNGPPTPGRCVLLVGPTFWWLPGYSHGFCLAGSCGGAPCPVASSEDLPGQPREWNWTKMNTVWMWALSLTFPCGHVSEWVTF
jgi:hypothetical protein